MKTVFCTHEHNGRSTKVEADRWQDTGNREWREFRCSRCGRIWREILRR